MKLFDMVKQEEVRHACKRLGLRNWSAETELVVSAKEADAVLNEIGGEALEISLEDFREGLQIELEHGNRFADANITNNHPILTGKIVLAHLKESLLYYKRLVIVELEGDLLKATMAVDGEKTRSVYERILRARLALGQAEIDFFASQ
jgi:hypothetical protein